MCTLQQCTNLPLLLYSVVADMIQPVLDHNQGNNFHTNLALQQHHGSVYSVILYQGSTNC
jgi:hypothetical protein